MFGFHSLDDDGLRRLIAKYEAGLASDVNYPCGGSRRQVRGWLTKARAELASR